MRWTLFRWLERLLNGPHPSRSGLDNAGKTTIVKRIMHEDVSTVSPTLGFSIKTVDYRGCGAHGKIFLWPWIDLLTRDASYKLNICEYGSQMESKSWPEEHLH